MSTSRLRELTKPAFLSADLLSNATSFHYDMLTWLVSERSLVKVLGFEWMIRIRNCSTLERRFTKSGICFLDCVYNIVDLSFFCCRFVCRKQWKCETSWSSGKCWIGKFLTFLFLIIIIIITIRRRRRRRRTKKITIITMVH